MVPYITLLTAFNYLKVHMGKLLSKKGQFKTAKDLQLIRVDAYVALRLAMKVYDSRIAMLKPLGQGKEAQHVNEPGSKGVTLLKES